MDLPVAGSGSGAGGACCSSCAQGKQCSKGGAAAVPLPPMDGSLTAEAAFHRKVYARGPLRYELESNALPRNGQLIIPMRHLKPQIIRFKTKRRLPWTVSRPRLVDHGSFKRKRMAPFAFRLPEEKSVAEDFLKNGMKQITRTLQNSIKPFDDDWFVRPENRQTHWGMYQTKMRMSLENNFKKTNAAINKDILLIKSSPNVPPGSKRKMLSELFEEQENLQAATQAALNGTPPPPPPTPLPIENAVRNTVENTKRLQEAAELIVSMPIRAQIDPEVADRVVKLIHNTEKRNEAASTLITRMIDTTKKLEENIAETVQNAASSTDEALAAVGSKTDEEMRGVVGDTKPSTAYTELIKQLEDLERDFQPFVMPSAPPLEPQGDPIPIPVENPPPPDEEFFVPVAPSAPPPEPPPEEGAVASITVPKTQPERLKVALWDAEKKVEQINSKVAEQLVSNPSNTHLTTVGDELKTLQEEIAKTNERVSKGHTVTHNELEKIQRKINTIIPELDENLQSKLENKINDQSIELTRLKQELNTNTQEHIGQLNAISTKIEEMATAYSQSIITQEQLQEQINTLQAQLSNATTKKKPTDMPLPPPPQPPPDVPPEPPSDRVPTRRPVEPLPASTPIRAADSFLEEIAAELTRLQQSAPPSDSSEQAAVTKETLDAIRGELGELKNMQNLQGEDLKKQIADMREGLSAIEFTVPTLFETITKYVDELAMKADTTDLTRELEGVREDMDDQNERMAQISENLTELGKLNDNSQKVIQGFQQEMADIKSQVAQGAVTSKNAIREINDKFDELKDYLQSQQTSVSTGPLETQIREQKAMFDTLRVLQDEVNVLRNQLHHMTNSKTQTQIQAVQQSANVDDASKDAMQTIYDQLDAVQQQLNANADKDNIILALQQAINVIEQTITNIQSVHARQIAELQSTIAQLEGQMQDMRTNLDTRMEITQIEQAHQRDQMMMLNNRIQTLASDPSSNQELVRRMQEIEQNTQAQLSIHSAAIRQENEQAIAILRRELAAFREANATIEKTESDQMEALRREIETTRSQLRDMQRILDNQQTDLENTNRINSQLRSQLREVNVRVPISFQTRIEELETQTTPENVHELKGAKQKVLQVLKEELNEKQNDKLAAYETQLSNYEGAQNTAEEQLKNLEQQLDGLEEMNRQAEEPAVVTHNIVQTVMSSASSITNYINATSATVIENVNNIVEEDPTGASGSDSKSEAMPKLEEVDDPSLPIPSPSEATEDLARGSKRKRESDDDEGRPASQDAIYDDNKQASTSLSSRMMQSVKNAWSWAFKRKRRNEVLSTIREEEAAVEGPPPPVVKLDEENAPAITIPPPSAAAEETGDQILAEAPAALPETVSVPVEAETIPPPPPSYYVTPRRPLRSSTIAPTSEPREQLSEMTEPETEADVEAIPSDVPLFTHEHILPAVAESLTPTQEAVSEIIQSIRAPDEGLVPAARPRRSRQQIAPYQAPDFRTPSRLRSQNRTASQRAEMRSRTEARNAILNALPRNAITEESLPATEQASETRRSSRRRNRDDIVVIQPSTTDPNPTDPTQNTDLATLTDPPDDEPTGMDALFAEPPVIAHRAAPEVEVINEPVFEPEQLVEEELVGATAADEKPEDVPLGEGPEEVESELKEKEHRRLARELAQMADSLPINDETNAFRMQTRRLNKRLERHGLNEDTRADLGDLTQLGRRLYRLYGVEQ